MSAKTMEQFNTINVDSLATIEGGKCTWGGLAGEVVGGAISGALKTKTWQGAAVNGGINGALYGLTCWW